MGNAFNLLELPTVTKRNEMEITRTNGGDALAGRGLRGMCTQKGVREAV